MCFKGEHKQNGKGIKDHKQPLALYKITYFLELRIIPCNRKSSHKFEWSTVVLNNFTQGEHWANKGCESFFYLKKKHIMWLKSTYSCSSVVPYIKISSQKFRQNARDYGKRYSFWTNILGLVLPSK